MTEFARPLRLVTPHEKGDRVRDAQWLLAGHNRFDGLAPYKDGDVDGDYGPLTAQAAKRAKWWLGYPETHCDGVFGQQLYEYLLPTPVTRLPDAFRQRRTARLRAAQAQTVGAAALEWARTQLGYHESPPGSNCTKYGEEYGWHCTFWCAMFETSCFRHSRKPWPRFRYASVELIVLDARALRNGLRVVRTPRPGDVFALNVPGEGPYGHTGFFVADLGGGSFRDLSGNTGPSSVSNGGMVLEQERHYSSVTAFVRVGP